MRFALILLVLWGVDAFAVEGKIYVSQKTVLNVTDGDKQFGPGTFTANLTKTRKGELRLEVSLAGRNNNPVAFFKVPRAKKIPSSQGTLALTAQESGQPYDFVGEWSSSFTDGREMRTTESCSYAVREPVCYTDHRGGTSCHIQERWVMGWRDIRYFDRETHSAVEFVLLEPQATANIANFTAETASVERIYLQTGHCL